VAHTRPAPAAPSSEPLPHPTSPGTPSLGRRASKHPCSKARGWHRVSMAQHMIDLPQPAHRWQAVVASSRSLSPLRSSPPYYPQASLRFPRNRPSWPRCATAPTSLLQPSSPPLAWCHGADTPWHAPTIAPHMRRLPACPARRPHAQPRPRNAPIPHPKVLAANPQTRANQLSS
jgi:hypothetical protein